MHVETWNAGAEHDDAIRARLKAVLLDLGYHPLDESWGVAGSQEIARWEFAGPLGGLTVEAETYVGLTISGPSAAVNEVRSRLQGRPISREENR
jgi:hypothetical protein